MTQASLPALVAEELLRLEAAAAAAAEAARRCEPAPAPPVSALLGRPLRLSPEVHLLRLQTDAVRTLSDPSDGRRRARRVERHVVVFPFRGEARVQVWPELGWRLLEGISIHGDFEAALRHVGARGRDRWTLELLGREWLGIFAWRGLVRAADGSSLKG